MHREPQSFVYPHRGRVVGVHVENHGPQSPPGQMAKADRGQRKFDRDMKALDGAMKSLGLTLSNRSKGLSGGEEREYKALMPDGTSIMVTVMAELFSKQNFEYIIDVEVDRLAP